MKTIYKLCASLSLCSILLLACTAHEPGTDNLPTEAELKVTHAQVLTATAQTRANLTHNGGEIRIAAYGKTLRYGLSPDGTLYQYSGAPFTMPRTHKQAKDLAAYGYVATNSYILPIHAAPADYDVTWSTTAGGDDTATLNGSIALTPAVAALNITLKDANDASLRGFRITAQGIYIPADPFDPNNWAKDDNDGTYHINPTTTLATDTDGTDILATPTSLTPGQAMLSISGGSGAYAGKTWTANVPNGLDALLPGKRYNLTVTLNGERAQISINNIDDWQPGTGKLLPKGYDVAVYTWEELKEVATKNSINTINVNVIQMADIVADDNDEWPSPILEAGKLYNGNGYTITGLKKTLFNWVYGWVYNTHLRDSDVSINTSSGGGGYGLLANANGGVITLCSATGSLTCNSTSDGLVHAGGLVGYNNSTITRSYTDVTLTVSNNGSLLVYAGGLAGSNLTITACATFGKIVKGGIGSITAGSVVGDNSFPGSGVCYSYALASGDIIGTGDGILNTGPCPALTLVKSATADTGIASESRTFDRDDGPWWTDGHPPTIDFTYEGIK